MPHAPNHFQVKTAKKPFNQSETAAAAKKAQEMQAAYSDERKNLAEDLTKNSIGNNSIISGDSMQRNSYDILQDGGKGFSLKDIVTVFKNA